ncbi:YkyA family protein [Bacillaceae bacterium W0354]
MKRLISSSILVLLIIALAACSDKHNAAEDIYPHLEKSVELEDAFKNAQTELVALEEEENELYSQIIEINMNELDQVKDIADQAITTAGKRQKLIDQELESIKASKNEFDSINEFIEQLDEEPKQFANEMVEMMNNRFEAFENLYQSYITSIEEDIKLYELLKDDELDKETLDEQVERVNQSYRTVKEHHQDFNDYTKQFNELKRKFYDASGLEVNYVERE